MKSEFYVEAEQKNLEIFDSSATIDPSMYSIYKNEELEVFCQKIKLLRNSWLQSRKAQISYPCAPLIGINENPKLSEYPEVKLLVHLKNDDTCNFLKSVDNRYRNKEQLIEYVKHKSKLLEIELNVKPTLLPLDVIVLSLEEIINSDNIHVGIRNYFAQNQDPNKYILRFKDFDEYLLRDVSIYNYSTFHKSWIDHGSINLELLQKENKLVNDSVSEEYDMEIYRIAASLINVNNDLLFNHGKIQNILKEFMLSVETLMSMFKSCENHESFGTLYSNGNSTEVNSKSFKHLSYYNTADYTNSYGSSKTSGSNLYHTNKIRDHVIILLSLATKIPPLIRNFHTFAYFTCIESLKTLSTLKKDISTNSRNSLLILHKELSFMIQIYYDSMHCIPQDIFSILYSCHEDIFNRNEMKFNIDPGYDDNFTFRLNYVQNLPSDWINTYSTYHIEMEVFFCSRTTAIKVSSLVAQKTNFLSPIISLDENITFQLKYKFMRKEMGIVFSLYGHNAEFVNGTKIATGYLKLFDHDQKLVGGHMLLGLITRSQEQKLKMLFRQIEMNKLSFDNPFIYISIPNWNYKISESSSTSGKVDSSKPSSSFTTSLDSLNDLLEPKNLEKIIEITKTNNYSQITKSNSKLIWAFKNELKARKDNCCYIPVILYCGMTQVASEQEFNAFLSQVEFLPEQDVYTLLGPMFSMPIIRKFALSFISKLDIEKFFNMSRVLVNCLSYEQNIWCYFVCMIVQRSWDCPYIAHRIFWHCYFLSDSHYSLNVFSIIMAVLMATNSEQVGRNFQIQRSIIKALAECGKRVQATQNPAKKKEILKDYMTKIDKNITGEFQLLSSSGNVVNRIDVNKCKVFSSASSPILISFKNSFNCGSNLSLIFKIGDILSRDMVTIEIFNALNRLWINNGYDLRMRTYDVVPTSYYEGALEVVPNVTTLADIHSMSGLTGTFDSESLCNWIRHFNKSPEDFKEAVSNFLHSCAGYCVATYILGICDRHNDNILLLSSGHLLHIDFNKYMGDSQKFLGISRDRVPFVLTPDMIYVINQHTEGLVSGYQYFAQICCSIYEIARVNAQQLFNILRLLLPSDVNVKKSLDYLNSTLRLDLSQNDAYIMFNKLIKKSVKATSTQVNFFIHNIAQKKKVVKLDKESSVGIFKFCDSPILYSPETDGEIGEAVVIDFVNAQVDDTPHTYFVIKVVRRSDSLSYVFRNISDFMSLSNQLNYIENYSELNIAQLSTVKMDKKNYIQDKSLNSVMIVLNNFLDLLLTSQMANSQIVYTFFHQFTVDEKIISLKPDAYQVVNKNVMSYIPEIKIGFSCFQDVFTVHISETNNLSELGLKLDDEISIQCVAFPDNIVFSSRKPIQVSERYFKEHMRFPRSAIYGVKNKIIVILKKHGSVCTTKDIGAVTIDVKSINLNNPDGLWYTIKPF